MSILKHFTEHPASVNETYGEHFRFATGTGTRMILGGIACCLHGLFPFTFTTTGSQVISSLYGNLSSGAREAIMARVEGNTSSTPSPMPSPGDD